MWKIWKNQMKIIEEIDKNFGLDLLTQPQGLFKL